MGSLNYDAFSHTGLSESELKSLVADPIKKRASAYEKLISQCDKYYNQIKALINEENEIIEDFDTKCFRPKG
jgi:flagellar biosynthesis chaperone FliJ